MGLNLPAKAAMNLDIPYSIDIDGKTPFDYCLASNNYECIIDIFKMMQKKGDTMMMDYNSFAYAVQNSGESSKRML